MKILVLRFSSIGDIVLTTPVVRQLKTQLPGAQVHFATKPAYRSLLEANPYVDKLHLLAGSLGELVRELRAERFDFIVDLHNNLRTRLIRLQLPGVLGQAFDKLNWQKYLLVRFKINRLPPVHIVDRYRAAAAPLGIRDDGGGLDYFIPLGQEVVVAEALPPGFRAGQYVAVAIGAQHATKRLPVEKLIELVHNLAPRPVVLLGGPGDESTGHVIELAAKGLVFNGCGQFSLHQSASLVRQAQFVVSHDTGLMHIASAFKKEIFSVWGNTVPQFGMYPYRTRFEALEVLGLPCRPCSKIGFGKCPQGHFKCMRNQDLAGDWPA
ncbi:glycosyl transferase [Hymenobacter sp. HMF4947]|uniref:Glycosyl transferase n=1 Tax=Hymenobacter ginkgonis TaxID=2682976 RepID=A0A7K1TIG6_9BACT|nr:glycosyltransferase family 9 protein [Hymenobacter ginkgonis]MVN78199.1 glycosyl transferase [Hymenobacter ginkgonis]